MNTLVQKETLGEELGVSLATINNWIKTEVIPSPDVHNCYTEAVYSDIICKLRNETNRLNSRANRSMQKKQEICYLGITNKKRKALLNNLVEDFEKAGISIDEGVLALSLALLRSNNLIDEYWINNKPIRSKIDILLLQWIKKSDKSETIQRLYSQYDIPNLDDDILGAFYQSIQSIAQRSNSGSYYTPSALLEGISVSTNKTVLDPCCGSGGVLLSVLSKKHTPSKIFARDIDETALKICFINFALFFNNANIAINVSKHDITTGNNNLFLQSGNEQFDYIITNPPWGSKFTKKEKENNIAAYPELKTSEIFSISLYNSLKLLKKNGNLFFFLPHAFLNVGAHRNIRKYIFDMGNKIHIKLLGNAFKGVVSESILLHFEKNTKENSIHIQNELGNVYPLLMKNIIPPDYIVSATSNDNDTMLLKKIYETEHTTLKENAIFALGIVTGNNVKYLLTNRTIKAEAIFRGRDIDKYEFSNPEYYIEFQPKLYQQIAPVEYYRQKKIVYRFISDKLICALDIHNTLLLNSANLFISNKYPMETIVSLFNSDIYTFIFRKKYHSKKVLKSHLQNLPLPILSSNVHQYIHNLYNKTFSSKNYDIMSFQNEMNMIICHYFSITNKQLNYIAGEQ